MGHCCYACGQYREDEELEKVGWDLFGSQSVTGKIFYLGTYLCLEMEECEKEELARA